MRQLNLNEIQQVSGSGVFLTALAATAVASTVSTAAFGWKAVAMAPFALTLSACATVITTVACIPVGFYTGDGFIDGATKALKYWALGPQAGWALEKKML